MIVFVDTNVILDIILKRQPFYTESYAVLEKIINEELEAYISASSITDIFYIATKVIRDKGVIHTALINLMTIVDVVSVTKTDILKALRMEINDFEDALQVQCALKIKANCVITRDSRLDGKGIKVVHPSNF